MSTLDKILEIDRELKILQEKKQGLLEIHTKEICPYTVGQVVTIQGYAHKGKLCRITDAWCRKTFSKGYKWRVRGIVLKKDGSDSRNNCDWIQESDK